MARTARSSRRVPSTAWTGRPRGAAPLGIAHRREVALGTGGFNENLWWDEHGELWRRMRRCGATFFAVPQKSGRQHLSAARIQSAVTILPQQRARAEANFHAHQPLYQGGHRPAATTGAARRILFASAHSVLDCSSGAAVATLGLLQALAATGFQCQAFCTPRRDLHHDVPFEEMIREMGESCEVRPAISGKHRANLLCTSLRGIPATFVMQGTRASDPMTSEDAATVLAFFHERLERSRPDVVLTYGWDPATCGMIALAKLLDIPVVFAIHSFGYGTLLPFWNADYCTVPSEFARRHYWESMGLACEELANPVDWDRVRCLHRKPRYVDVRESRTGEGRVRLRPNCG